MKTGKYKKKIIYIAEFSLPNMSAYAIHVLKMCDNLSKLGYEVELLLPYINKSYKLNKIKDDYLLKRKYKIHSIFNSRLKLNFIYRIIFSLKILFYLKKIKSNMLLSRSIIPSLILSIFGFNNILEIHTELSGITSYIFKLTKLDFIKKKLKFVVLNSKLINLLKIDKNQTIILEDAVEFSDFSKKNIKIKKNTCVYSGSFVPGKGIEIICSLAKKMPQIKFELYGNINTLDKNFNLKTKPKNLIFKGFISYKKIASRISSYKILLMPYQKKVDVLMRGINVSSYFSPLKLFEYMATGRIILASKLKVYNKILKHNKNSILLDPDNINDWVQSIDKNFKTNRFAYLGHNAKKNVKKYSWEKRAKKIVSFYENNNFCM